MKTLVDRMKETYKSDGAKLNYQQFKGLIGDDISDEGLYVISAYAKALQVLRGHEKPEPAAASAAVPAAGPAPKPAGPAPALGPAAKPAAELAPAADAKACADDIFAQLDTIRDEALSREELETGLKDLAKFTGLDPSRKTALRGLRSEHV